MRPGRRKKDRAVIVPLSDTAAAIINEAIDNRKQEVVFPSKFGDGTRRPCPTIIRKQSRPVRDSLGVTTTGI
jgi:integrase